MNKKEKIIYGTLITVIVIAVIGSIIQYIRFLMKYNSVPTNAGFVLPNTYFPFNGTYQHGGKKVEGNKRGQVCECPDGSVGFMQLSTGRCTCYFKSKIKCPACGSLPGFDVNGFWNPKCCNPNS